MKLLTLPLTLLALSLAFTANSSGQILSRTSDFDDTPSNGLGASGDGHFGFGATNSTYNWGRAGDILVRGQSNFQGGLFAGFLKFSLAPFTGQTYSDAKLTFWYRGGSGHTAITGDFKIGVYAVNDGAAGTGELEDQALMEGDNNGTAPGATGAAWLTSARAPGINQTATGSGLVGGVSPIITAGGFTTFLGEISFTEASWSATAPTEFNLKNTALADAMKASTDDALLLYLVPHHTAGTPINLYTAEGSATDNPTDPGKFAPVLSIPEPGTTALLLGGLVCALAVLRRRR